jgi:hypothetical protein
MARLSSTKTLRREIEAAARAGKTWEEIAQMLDSCALNEDTREALWLYAWGCLQRSDGAAPTGTASVAATTPHSAS